MNGDLTPAQRALRARIAANSRVARPDYDPREATAQARACYWERYFDEVDPERRLSPEIRDRKAKAAWRRDMDLARFNKSRRTRRPNRRPGE